MSICKGKTKTEEKCTKKIKSTDFYCHLHKDQDTIEPKNNDNSLIMSNDIPKAKLLIGIPKNSLPVEGLKDSLLVEDSPKILLSNVDNALKIWTFNINSVRNKMDIVNALLLKHDIDILFLTETKIQPKLEAELKFNSGYKTIWNSNKNSYHHGVCFICKTTLQIELLSDFLPTYDHEIDDKKKVTKNSDVIEEHRSSIAENTIKAFNTEGRILTIKCTFNKKEIIIVGTYVPNSGSDRKQPLRRLGFRVLSWDKSMFCYLLELEKKYENVILTGDLNVCIRDNDLLNVNANIPGCTFEERQSFNEFLNKSQWIDCWHECNKNIIKCKNRATWGVNTKFPLRLDYVICSPSLKNNIISSFNDQKCDGSDHVPVGITALIEIIETNI